MLSLRKFGYHLSIRIFTLYRQPFKPLIFTRITPDINHTTPDVNRTKPHFPGYKPHITPDINRITPDINRTTPDINRTTPDVKGRARACRFLYNKSLKIRQT